MRLTLVFLIVFCQTVSYAQPRCAAVERTALTAARSAAYASGLLSMDSLIAAFETGAVNSEMGAARNTIDIPVVVHVIYDDEENNISNEQIWSQMEVLNRDFQGENSDRTKVPDIWQGTTSATQFRFHLADRDPDGNFTHGITRHKTTIENIGSTEVYYKGDQGGVDPWPQPHYLNVWVCDIEGLTLGFSILPSANMAPSDGVVMSPRAFGTMGTAEEPYNGGRTFVHEVGHYFGLRHLWGSEEGTCTSTDYMSDTPWQRGPNYGCKDFPSVSCQSEVPNGDMFMNFMDYATDTCAVMFTKRQVEFMHLVYQTSRSALAHSPGYTGTPELDDQRLTVYPNPAEDVVRVERGDSEGSITVWDAKGQLWIHLSSEDRVVDIDVSALPAGLYLLRCAKVSRKLLVH